MYMYMYIKAYYRTTYTDLVSLVLSPACLLHEILCSSLPVWLPGASLVVPRAPVVMSTPSSSVHPIVVAAAVVVPVSVPPAPVTTAPSVSPAPLLRAAIHPAVSGGISVPSVRARRSVVVTSKEAGEKEKQ